MRNIVLVLIVSLLVILGCTDESKQNENKQIDKTTISKPSKNHKVIQVGKGPDALFLTPDEKTLYVANVEDNFISIINTESEEVIGKIEGIRYPWGFTRCANSNTVAVSGYDKQISLIDFTTHKVIKQKDFTFNLGGITSSSDGNFNFVVGAETERAYKLDSHNLNIIDEYKTGKGPDGIGISKDNNKLYVTNTLDGTISVINVETKKSKLLEVGGKPELVHYNKDHSLLFISNFKLNKIHIINTNTDEIVHEITELNSPEEAVLSKSEKFLYVVNFGNKKVYVYNAITYKKLDSEFSVGNKPIGVVSALNDTKLFVSNYGDNTVSVLNLSKHK